MALPLSTANWHWKNKDVTPWGKDWFERELTTLTVQGDGEESVSVSEVSTIEGDIELGQRKSKLITIYEVKLELKWRGTASDGTEVEGKLTIPEVSHEITLDQSHGYEYIWSLTTESSPAVDALFALAQERLPTALETKFAQFPSVMIETHGKDLTVSADPSRSSTPAPSAALSASHGGKPSGSISSATPTAPGRASGGAEKKEPISTSTVVVKASYMASASDLFKFLTEEQAISMWTRAPAKSKAEAGTEYSLFGGNVVGKYISLKPPTEIVQSWALWSPVWPSDHTGTLSTSLEQSSESTNITFTLSGVPTGIEDITRGNLEGYYVQGLKSIGYVQSVLSSQPPPAKPPRVPSEETRPYAAIAITVLVLAAAFSIPYLSSLPLLSR